MTAEALSADRGVDRQTIGVAPGSTAAQLAPPRIGPATAHLSPRQREILDQLDRIFAEEGFAQMTTKELAARLRCSRRTLYELAPSKDELVLVVLDRQLRRIGRLAAEALQSVDDPADRLEAFMHAGASEMKRTTIQFREDMARFPAGQRVIAAHFRYASALLADIIDEGIDRKRFRAVHAGVIAEIIDAALERVQDPTILRTHGNSFEEAAFELTTLLRAGLSVGQPRR